MFSKRKVYDVSVKEKKTLFGGTKMVPTTKSEQRAMKKEILRRDPRARFKDDDPLDKMIMLDEIFDD